MPRYLTAGEIADLLNRNFDLNAKVLAHERIVSTGTWNQERMSVFPKLPIPTWGLSVKDETYGNVVVYPEASGALRYSGFVGSELLGDINKPTFVSPTNPGGRSFWEQALVDLKDTFGVFVLGAIVLTVLYVWVKSEGVGRS